MKRRWGAWMSIFLALSFDGQIAHSQVQLEMPIDLEFLGEKALVVRTGSVYPDQIVAISSESGIVIIDTGISASLSREYRKTIENELGREDFKLVVNTHHHFDHTNGNQVFSDATIVGHMLSPVEMTRFAAGIQGFVAARRERYERRTKWLQDLPPGSEMASRFRDLIFTSKKMCDDLEGNLQLTTPSMTFEGRMTVNLGDMTLKLFSFGAGFHSTTDIVAHVPELGLVFTGDLLRAYESTSTITSGTDVDRGISVLREILAEEAQATWVVTNHAGVLPGSRLSSLLDKLETIAREKEEKLSAAVAFQEAMEQSGFEEAVDRIRESWKEGRDHYYFLEGDFSEIGHQLLEERNSGEAVVTFSLITELFPESVDAHENLGDALIHAGELERARESFRRALGLFPLNSGAYDMIKTLESRIEHRFESSRSPTATLQQLMVFPPLIVGTHKDESDHRQLRPD